MKLLKIGLGLLLALLVILGIFVAIAFNNLNVIVEEMIETSGTETLKTAVNVAAVDIALIEGKGAINGIAVDNPGGYSNDKILTVGSVGVQLDVQSLTKDVIVIKEAYVDGVEFLAEHKNLTDTNIQALFDNLPKGKDTANTASSSPSSSADVRLMIESLRVGESKIKLATEQYGGRQFTLPSYVQTNIGNKATGLSPDQIAQAIMSSLLSRAKNAVKTQAKVIAKEALDKELDEQKRILKNKATDKLKEKISPEDIDTLKSLFK
ncbi:MAG: hypothetical protein AAFZ92_08265 [Pseudomonadota bacterium]